MLISTKGRYALRMLVDLAEHQNDGYVALKDIAKRQGISKKYLEQIVPLLNKSDILRTNRGFNGGYRLAKSPDKYTVGDILRITEGSLSPVACLESDRACAVAHVGRREDSGLASVCHCCAGADCLPAVCRRNHPALAAGADRRRGWSVESLHIMNHLISPDLSSGRGGLPRVLFCSF